MSDDLDVDVVDFVAFEPFLRQFLHKLADELVLRNVAEGVVFDVVEMRVVEGVEVEEHLIVSAEPVLVNP